jgi:hypothetical protein
VAVVYKASDLHSDMRHVAVKLFAESQAHTWLGAEFFARECRVPQELRHPAVIDLLDWGTDDATGERLSCSNGRITRWRRVVAIRLRGWDSFYDDVGRPILEALSFAHGRRVWHPRSKARERPAGTWLASLRSLTSALRRSISGGARVARSARSNPTLHRA